MAADRSLLARTIVAASLLFWLLLHYAAPMQASPHHWPARPNVQDAGHRTLYIVPAQLLTAEDVDSYSDRDVSVEVPALVESPRLPDWTATRHSSDIQRPMAKRQVRYHQCYFNPISCFG